MSSKNCVSDALQQDGTWDTNIVWCSTEICFPRHCTHFPVPLFLTYLVDYPKFGSNPSNSNSERKRCSNMTGNALFADHACGEWSTVFHVHCRLPQRARQTRHLRHSRYKRQESRWNTLDSSIPLGRDFRGRCLETNHPSSTLHGSGPQSDPPFFARD